MANSQIKTIVFLLFGVGICVFWFSCDSSNHPSKSHDAPRNVSIVINDDAEVTRDTLLRVSISADNVAEMKLSQLPSLEDAEWEEFDTLKIVQVPRQEGVFTIYGTFRSPSSAETNIIQDSIRLDFNARIVDFSVNTPSDTLRPGDWIDFTIDAGEPGFAEVGFGSLIIEFQLVMEADTVFRRRMTLPPIIPSELVCAVGKFTDQAGNNAETVVFQHPYILQGHNLEPRIIQTLEFGSPCNDEIIYQNGYCYVTDRYYLHVIDFRNPEEPLYIYGLPLLGWAHGMALRNDVLFVTDNSNNMGWLRVIDIEIPDQPIRLGSVPIPGLARSVAVCENYAYVSSELRGVQIFDISNLENPHPVADVRTTCTCEDLVLADSTIFVAGDGGMAIIDVRDPRHPEIISQYSELSDEAVSILLWDSDLYLTTLEAGVLRVDVSNLEQPRLVAEYQHLETALGVAITHPYMFVTRSRTLSVANYSNLQELPILAELRDLDVSRGIFIDGDRLFVVLRGGLAAIGLTDAR